MPRLLLLVPLAMLLAYLATPVAVGKPVVDMLDVDSLRPGMRGYGLTVFRGTEPERFDVEIIDVLHNFRPDQDLILVRTEHPVLERATTVAGMSGSPIYIDDKLIGAYAYGWQFGREPVAGVTPIASMMAELARPLRPTLPTRLGHPAVSIGAPRRIHPGVANPDPSTDPTHAYTGQRTDAFAGLEAWGTRARTLEAGPYALRAATPLLVGGMTDDVVGMLDERLAGLGLDVLQAGGSQRSTRAESLATTNPGKASSGYVDGGAVGVQLVRGDISATAVGTVTHVAGKRLIGFGHPMLNAGQVALPAATARIVHVLASEQRSFKIAEALGPVGTLIQDRQATIVVDTQREAPTVPMTIRIHGIDAPRTRWNVALASHRLLTPMLAFSAIASAVGVTAGDQDDVMFDARTRVHLSTEGAIEVRDLGYSPAGAASGSALSRLRLFDLLSVAYDNPFEPVEVRRIELDLHLRHTREVSEIVEAAVASDDVNPGRPLSVYVRLRPYAGPEQVKIVQVPIPSSAAGKEIEILVRPGSEVAVERSQPRGVPDLVKNVQSSHLANQLALSIKEPARGLSMRGHVVRALPGSALDTLMLANSSERGTPFATETHHLTDVPHVLTGSSKLKLQVRETPR